MRQHMDRQDIPRRSFVLTGAGMAAAGLVHSQASKPGLTAVQVIERIKTNIGIPWREQTVDRIIAGDPEIPVKGIATTMMATLDVIQRASAAGKNMVITHEPTFYSHQDTTAEFKDDATYQFKAEFIRRNNMVVFRFHDHWHAAHTDGIALGMTRDLGWEKNVDPQNERLFSFHPTPLARFAKDIEARLKIRTMRVLGDPALTVNRAIASWGYVSQMPGIQLLARPDVDVLIGGETREWEVVEYAQDIISSGKKKALIILGHVVSEQAGMKYCVEWLNPFLPEVPIEFVAAAEPFWRPDNPIG
jgi:putative NIF3 family GTP cyclohydrolase 1 type 2